MSQPPLVRSISAVSVSQVNDLLVVGILTSGSHLIRLSITPSSKTGWWRTDPDPPKRRGKRLTVRVAYEVRI